MTSFKIDESSDLPVWVQIKNRVVYLIETGELEPGSQLPSVRSFAAELQVSYNTVSKAYMALSREGYAESRHGSGAYVKGLVQGADVSQIDFMIEDFVKSCVAAGMQYDDIPGRVNVVVQRMKRGNNG